EQAIQTLYRMGRKRTASLAPQRVFMYLHRVLWQFRKCIFCVGLLTTMQAGCGIERLQPPLNGLVEGLSLEDLERIQDDERLTDDEKREAIRAAAEIPAGEEGDRLVE